MRLKVEFVNSQSLLPNLILSSHPYDKMPTEKENDSSPTRKDQSKRIEKSKAYAIRQLVNLINENYGH